MAYTPHTWANGDSGENAPAWLNNMEEGVSAAMATAEDTAEDYDASDANSLYSLAQALRTGAAGLLQQVNVSKSQAREEQTKLNVRNSYLKLSNGAAGTGSGIVVSNLVRSTIGAFPLANSNATSFVVSAQGYYQFIINSGVYGPNATIKIRKNYVSIETLKLMEFQDVSTAQELAIISTSVVHYLLVNDRIDFLMYQDGSGASLSGFRVTVRKL